MEAGGVPRVRWPQVPLQGVGCNARQCQRFRQREPGVL